MEMLDRLLAWHGRLRPRLIGIEQNGGYALIRPLLSLRAGGGFVPVRYVNHTEPKELRIERLSPEFEAGLWLFPSNPGPGVRVLQEQLLNYPGGFVDGPDALAGCSELLPDPVAPADAAQPLYRRLGPRSDFAEL